MLERVHGIRLRLRLRKALKQHGTTISSANEFGKHRVERSLVGCGKVFEAEILRVVSNQSLGAVSEMPARRDEVIDALAKRRAGIPVQIELGAGSIVHEENSDVCPHMAIPQGIHVVEKRQIAEDAEYGLARRRKRRANRRRTPASGPRRE